MILHVNHVPAKQTALASNVAATLVAAAGEGQIPPRILENLNVHLEWLQYKTNFREALALRRAIRGNEALPWIEVGVDLRQVRPDSLKGEFVSALHDAADAAASSRKRCYLEPFAAIRSSLIWRFNN